MRCLIIGQGIAGTVLACILQHRGLEVIVADADYPFQSSGAAAGIINPITGKRYVKSWRLDEFFPVARAFYTRFESEFGVQCWHETPLYRLLTAGAELNNWSVRQGDPEYSAWMGDIEQDNRWKGLLRPGFYAAPTHAARVDFPSMLRAFREKAVLTGGFLPLKITPEQVVDHLNSGYDFVVFCEGYRGRDNPWFPKSGWQLVKGEGFLFRHSGSVSPLSDMVKRNLLLAPLSDGLVWAGAGYSWTFDEHSGPTTEGQADLEKELTAMLTVPYDVVRRFGAVRPAVKDRRPVLGISPLHPKLVLFNGLGTKGALLAPYWAGHLADHLLSGTALDSAVDIRRFT